MEIVEMKDKLLSDMIFKKNQYMKAGFKLLAVLVSGIFIATGCGSTENKEINFDSDASQVTKELNVPDAEQLLVYTSHKPEVYEPIIQEFEARTGIWVSVITGGTNELMEEIRVEKGNPQADVLFGGGVESFAVNQDLFMQYEASDMEALKAIYQGKLQSWTPFTELPIVIIYNNKLLSEAEAPRGFSELLEDRFRGRIAFADPQVSQSSATILSTMILALGRDEEMNIVKSFADSLEGTVLDSSGAVLDEVAEGNYAVGLTLEETARKYIDRGADLSIGYPVEGTSAVPDACGIIQGAKHEDNAKKFVDFIIGEDVQRLAEDKLYRRSIREGIRKMQNEDMKLLDYDLEWAIAEQQVILNAFADSLEKSHD